MCDPVTATVVAGVMTVASAVGGVVAQTHAANVQASAINSQLETVATENRNSASAEIFDRMRAARREQARIRVAAGEAGLGLSSQSIGQLLLDSAMQSDLANQRTLANRESRDAAARADATSAMSQVHKPTAIGAGLQIGSAVVGSWSDISKARVVANQRAGQ